MTSPVILRRFPFALLLALSVAPAVRGQAPDTQDRRAFITVRVNEEATVTVDGKATTQKGGVRHFYSPPLEPGKTYHYNFVVKWNPTHPWETYTVNRKVQVAAGKTTEVDLSEVKPDKGDTIEIIYVPTPQKTVDAMMKLAKVGEDDVIYDLGCGDGRIVVTAVQKFHAKRGVGVDLHAERIREANDNAKKAGVEDKVEFRKGDVLQVKDLSEASVVMLYLSDDLNQQVRQTLFKQLKPGTRIVSHRFTMGDWKPEKTETIDIDDDIDDEKLIHLWTIGKK